MAETALEDPTIARAALRCERCGASIHSSDAAVNADPLRATLLVGLLTTAVFVAQHDLSRVAWIDVERVARDAATEIGSHADDLQFGGKRCASTFAALARGLAAISFAPGGVSFLGAHWCAQHPESTSHEGQYRRAAA